MSRGREDAGGAGMSRKRGKQEDRRGEKRKSDGDLMDDRSGDGRDEEICEV